MNIGHCLGSIIVTTVKYFSKVYGSFSKLTDRQFEKGQLGLESNY